MNKIYWYAKILHLILHSSIIWVYMNHIQNQRKVHHLQRPISVTIWPELSFAWIKFNFIPPSFLKFWIHSYISSQNQILQFVNGCHDIADKLFIWRYSTTPSCNHSLLLILKGWFLRIWIHVLLWKNACT